MSVYLGNEQQPLFGVVGDDPRNHATREVGRDACKLIIEGMVTKAKKPLDIVGFSAE